MGERVVAAVRAIAARHPGETVLVVTHGGTDPRAARATPRASTMPSSRARRSRTATATRRRARRSRTADWRGGWTRLDPVEDYTNKYKGEQVEVALFGGDYQDGVLTAYCYVEDVAHIELNGHILIPLQNIASLHCSSRCDAPEPDWPPRGLDEADRTSATTSRRAVSFRLVVREPPQGLAPARRSSAPCSAASAGCSAATGSSVFVFCGLLLALGIVLVLRPGRARDGRRAGAARRRGARAALDRRAARGRAGLIEAAPLRDRRTRIRARSRPAAARAARRSSSAAACSMCDPGGARGDPRARARARPQPRPRRADLGRRLRGRARRDEPDRRLPRAGAPVRARAGRGGARPPDAVAEAGVRRRPRRGRGSATRRTASRTR